MHSIRCAYEHLLNWTVEGANTRLEQLVMFGGYQFDPNEVRTTPDGSLHFTGRRSGDRNDTYNLFLTF